jgi:hypothetical protein
LWSGGWTGWDETWPILARLIAKLEQRKIAITLWNTVYLERAAEMLAKSRPFDPDHLQHVSPLSWEHINLTAPPVRIHVGLSHSVVIACVHVLLGINRHGVG